jgi:hypothetical protein
MSASAGTEKPERAKLLESVWFRGALVITFVEGILIVFDVIPRWVAIGVAIAVIAAYFLRGRGIKDASVRQAVWAVTFSQAVVLLVPLIGWIVSAAVIVVLAVLAALVIFWLIIDR